ncbi:MAG: hypothetical protein WDN08_06110 [Rhizomicrobium sp.]
MLERFHHALYVEMREQAGREASPPAAIIGSESAKTAPKGGFVDPQGYDAGEKVTGHKQGPTLLRCGSQPHGATDWTASQLLRLWQPTESWADNQSLCRSRAWTKLALRRCALSAN